MQAYDLPGKLTRVTHMGIHLGRWSQSEQEGVSRQLLEATPPVPSKAPLKFRGDHAS